MHRPTCLRPSFGVGALAALALAALAPDLAAQTGSITGRITNEAGGQPIPSVQVFISDLDLGVLSQQNGSYNLTNVPAGTQTVTVQRLGYREAEQTVQVAAGQAIVLNFELSQAALQLDEVIVTGTPGGTQRRAIGNAVTRLDAADVVERAVITDVQDLLSARTPGLNYQRVPDNVGGGSPIRIRGVASLELGAEPLIYVDGIRIDNDQTLGPTTGSGTGGASNALNDINPNDIESIEVVKGPAAATLYGSEASAGVIQIITKKGASGEPEFTFTTRQGTNFMPDPVGKIGTQYYCWNEATNSPGPARCPDDMIRTYNIYEHERDFNGNELFRYGLAQSYNMSVRGGTDQVRYYLSGEWTDDEGVVPWNWDNSKSARANITVLLTNDLTLDVSAGYVEGETRYGQATSGQGGIWNDMKWASGSSLNSNYPAGDIRGRLRGFQEHTPENIADVEALRDYQRFTGSLTAQHSYGGWLTQRLIVGLDKSWDTNSNYFPLDPEGFFAENSLGEVTFARPEVTNQTLDYGVSARYQLTDAIGTTTSVGAQYNSRYREEISNTGSGFASSLQRSINQTSPSNFEIDYDVTDSKSLGFYIQEELSLNDRLYLTAAVRADDSSTFGSDFDLVYYPKISGAWVVSEESFWGVDFINSLRLRAAWGEAGRQPSAFSAQDIYTTFAGPGGIAGLAPASPGNALIKPERSREIEVGFDIAVLDDRLSGEFTYFDVKTSDAITDDPLAPSFGFPGNLDRNLGEIQNWGWEALIDARILDRDNLAFDFAVSASNVENEIRDLGGSLESANFQRGHPYPAVVGARVVSAEFIPGTNTLDQERTICDAGAGPYASDDDGDGIVTGNLFSKDNFVPCNSIPEQQLLYGPSVPPYSFTLAPTLTLFNDLQVFALAEGQYGGWFADIQAEFGGRRNNSFNSVCQCNPIYEAAENSRYDDERYFGRVQADFWKLREFGVRYNLPQSLLERVNADRASISVSARNWWTIWNGAKTDLGGQVIADPESRGQSSGQTGGTLTNTYAGPGFASVGVSMRVTF